MKRLVYTLPALMLILGSCSGGCDNSTAEGAVECYCGLIEEKEAAGDDADKRAEIDERGEAWEDEVDAHIKKGDYSASEFGLAMLEADCKR